MVFWVVFPERSFPMDASCFTRIDPLNWLLDLTTIAGGSYHTMKVCVFLLSPISIPRYKALVVYAQAPGQPFIFCGGIHANRPSALFSFPWPDESDAAALSSTALSLATPDITGAKIRVSLEDVATLSRPPSSLWGGLDNFEQDTITEGMKSME